jgi:hypothetical protein
VCSSTMHLSSWNGLPRDTEQVPLLLKILESIGFKSCRSIKLSPFGLDVDTLSQKT